jgi:hypothetical protein
MVEQRQEPKIINTEGKAEEHGEEIVAKTLPFPTPRAGKGNRHWGIETCCRNKKSEARNKNSGKT